MSLSGKILGLLLASLALASCGGGGGSDGGAFSPPQSGKLELSATTTTLPLNTQGQLPGQHGSTQAEITITMRNADGSLMTGQDVSISISPVEVAALSFLVSDDNDDINNLWGTFTIKGTNGVATAWVNSRQVAGTAVVTASATDPATSRSISASLRFTVTSGVGPQPASVQLSPTRTNVYLPSSGGSSTTGISATVRDGGGQYVPDPMQGNTGVDNVLFELAGETGDARLSTNSASGPASGKSVASHTVKGIAMVSFEAGEATPQGPVQIRATIDRADNNVSNGIQDPVTATTSVVVSDGKLYSLEITSPLYAPNLPGITINPVSPDASLDGDSMIPPDPDATLTLRVTALAKDRQGNPPLPGTPVRFGLVDSPVGAPGTSLDNVFLLSGVDGNPQEGGKLFTAPGGRFTTGGVNGANSGDALLVFGRAVEGNADLESAATVTSVNSATSLNVTPAFNYNYRNDVPFDSGPVLPYLIGRALHGNITAVASTDELGRAHAELTYTVNNVGDSLAIWAQGDGIDRVKDIPKRVTAAGTLVYPGVAPATLWAAPNPIFGNATQNVTVCVADALGIPLRGISVGFGFELPGGGTGTVDGRASGSFANLTGVDGCTVGQVQTSGVPATDAEGGVSGTLVIGAAGQTTSVGIVVQIATLQAAPNSVPVACSGATATIRITARSAQGAAVPNTPISGSCSASGGAGATISLTPSNANTNGDGVATFNARASGFVGAGSDGGLPVVGEGQCTFTAPGNRSVTVDFRGFATAEDFSPPDAGCGAG